MIRTIKTWLCRMFGHTLECQHEWKRTRAYIRECQLWGREEVLFYNRCHKESTEIIDKLRSSKRPTKRRK